MLVKSPSITTNFDSVIKIMSIYVIKLWCKNSWHPNNPINLILFLRYSRNLTYVYRACELVNLSSSWRHCNKTAGLAGNKLQNITTCENGWSNFSENLRSVAIKVPEFSSIRITKSINLLQFLTGVGGVRCDVDIFILTATYREVNYYI